MKLLVFDMDGTLADLYAVDNWLDKLRAEDSTPYRDAKGMVDFRKFNKILKLFQSIDWKIQITTWGSMNASDKYNRKVEKVKKSWCKKHHIPVDIFVFQSYGTPKSKSVSKGDTAILFDDNEKVRNDWAGISTDEKAIVEKLTVLYNQLVAEGA